MEPKIILHGGIESKNTRDKEKIENVLEEICQRAYEQLIKTNAVDAVEYAIAIMEDDSLFNAGTGAMLQFDGVQRMDASIMDGYTLNSGAVAQIRSVRNPIKVARIVMEKTKHRLIVGDEAQKFAYLNGVGYYDPLTREAFERWFDNKNSISGAHYGTVGAVAIDKDGRIAAGTSTGGWVTALPGRTGDVPIIGAGTYADKYIGVSCTGDGDKISAIGLAHRVGFYVEEKHTLLESVKKGLDRLREVSGIGGLIAIDGNFNIAFMATASNAYMPVSYMPKK